MQFLVFAQFVVLNRRIRRGSVRAVMRAMGMLLLLCLRMGMSMVVEVKHHLIVLLLTGHMSLYRCRIVLALQIVRELGVLHGI